MIFLLLSLVPALALLHPAATNQTKCLDSWLSNAAAGNRLRGKEKELHKRRLPTPSFLPHHFPFMASTCSIEGETDADVTPGFSYFSCRVQILLKRTKSLQRKGGEEKWDIVVNSGRVKTITMSLLQHFFFFFFWKQWCFCLPPFACQGDHYPLYRSSIQAGGGHARTGCVELNSAHGVRRIHLGWQNQKCRVSG